MGIFYRFPRPELPAQTKLSSSSGTKTTAVRIGEITRCDLFKRNGVVAVVHNRLREKRRFVAVDVLKEPDHISGSVGGLPCVTGFIVSFDSKLPSGGMVMEKMGNATPVDVISGVGASAFS